MNKRLVSVRVSFADVHHSSLVSSAVALTGQYVGGPRSELRGPPTLVTKR